MGEEKEKGGRADRMAVKENEILYLSKILN